MDRRTALALDGRAVGSLCLDLSEDPERSSAATGALATARALRRAVGTVGAVLETAGRARMAVRESSPRSKAHVRARLLRGFMQRFVELHDVEVTVDGAVPSGPALWVANRVQPLDLPVLLSLGKAVPLVDAEVADWPLLGAQAAKLGCLFVDRGCLSSGASVLRQAGAAWSAGLPVLGFPELRRTDGRSPLQPFRRGLFGAAQLAQVPVVPFCLRYESEPARHPDLRRPWPHYWAWSRRARTRVTVRIGDPLSPTAGSTPESLASLTRLQVALLGAPRAVLGVC